MPHTSALKHLDYLAIGRSLMRSCAAVASFEAASQVIARTLYERILDANDDPALVLVRLYRVVRLEELPPDLSGLLTQGEKYAIALMGTYGDQAAWRSRQQSAEHKIIPINNVAVPAKIPMFERLLVNDMQVDLKHLYSTGDVMTSIQRPSGGTFLIEQAVDSDLIPAQDEFIKPYGVKSLIGFGGLVPDPPNRTTLYLLTAFSRVSLTKEIASNFFLMQPYIAIGLDSTSEHRIFSE